MKFKSYIYLALAALGLSLASCGDDYEYQAAEKPADDCMAVYFTTNNESLTLLTSDEFNADPSINVEVARVKTDKAASVPVIVKDDDGVFEIPSTVEFAAGDTTAYLKISFPNLPSAQTCTFSIAIADEYVNPYLQLDGSDQFIASVLVAKWVPAIQGITNKILDSDSNYTQSDTESDLYWLEGLNRFRMTNFLGSGVDLTFELSNASFDANDTSTWVGLIIPLDHYYMRTTSWYLLDDEGNYASWTTDDIYPGIKRFLIYYGGGYGYFYFNGPSASGDEYSAWLRTYVYFLDGSKDYGYAMLYWDDENIVLNK
jgi:hypothetical protein